MKQIMVLLSMHITFNSFSQYAVDKKNVICVV